MYSLFPKNIRYFQHETRHKDVTQKMCYFRKLIIFCTFSLATKFFGVGASVTKGNSNIFHSIPYYQTVLFAAQQSNTKITPRASHRASNSKTERGQSSHTDVTRTRLYDKTDIYDNIVYFLYNFFRHLPKNLKTAMSAILFTIPKEIQTTPLLCWNTETVIQITQSMCYLWK